MDLNPGKIDKFKVGFLPIWEPGLEVLVERIVKEGRLHFTAGATQPCAWLADGVEVFICSNMLEFLVFRVFAYRAVQIAGVTA